MQEIKIGETDWFNLRRKLYPAPKKVVPGGGFRLSRDLIKTGKQITSLPSLLPAESPLLPGGPRLIGRTEEKYLRRFSGRKVQGADFTQIYDSESRKLYRDTTYPWVCIGRVDNPVGTMGTGTLVGRNTILTAAHVAWGMWTPGGPITGNPTFTAAYFDGKSLLGSNFVANIIGVAAWENTKNNQCGYDMAVCQLDRPLGDWLGFFGANSYDDDWEDRAVWAHAGYPYDLSPNSARPCFELGIAVRDDDSDSYDTLEIETRADIASGQSGGPLWGVFEGDRRVIGTLSGREDNFGEETNSLFAGGNGLLQLIRWGRDHWG